ncbi:hypothetical protein Mp_3g08050 [Marchantia polymorpha subsp. ruderalis]|uniref:Uncharacterized protein n=2 Tax=Marchantia polymorpha TaxID=3197 RepID=A0AAF6AYK3_MARPO|nr:hypothetical protein MARPO_0006s0281 [Marchantia polymorpha]BBN04837.1 hypothetical protein Mp_3g08050 [Marchantia polymorpha subsp. ruderalis]|eukprot:PTQ48289.1 hypothetical protein MARPO_0006s0281 [Marchantia polymorpha]
MKNGSICFDSGGPTYTAASWQSRCINGTPIVEAPIPAANLTINGTSNATTNVTIPGARRRALLSEFRSPNVLPDLDCTRHVEVDDNVIYYREDPTKFIWSLRVDKADKAAMMQQLAAVPKSDKAFWLFTHGATTSRRQRVRLRLLLPNFKSRSWRRIGEVDAGLGSV